MPPSHPYPGISSRGVWGDMNKIIISGDISEENFQRFSEELTEFEKEEGDTVELELYSQGGDAEVALAFTGRMRTSPCYVNVTVYGAAYSAAALILAAGDKRTMTSESWVMVHEDSGKTSGTVAQREKDIAHCRRLENQWNILMEFYTGISKDRWAELHRAETYLNANQCLELGLVDKVI